MTRLGRFADLTTFAAWVGAIGVALTRKGSCEAPWFPRVEPETPGASLVRGDGARLAFRVSVAPPAARGRVRVHGVFPGSIPWNPERGEWGGYSGSIAGDASPEAAARVLARRGGVVETYLARYVTHLREEGSRERETRAYAAFRERFEAIVESWEPDDEEPRYASAKPAWRHMVRVELCLTREEALHVAAALREHARTGRRGNRCAADIEHKRGHAAAEGERHEPPP